MPKLTVGEVTVDVPFGKRLVNALVDEAQVDQLHACGGVARCTTCRVKFVSGKPEKMTEAEKAVREQKGLADQPDVRLSCQILCDSDMTVEAISRVSTSGRPSAGERPAEFIEPPPVWTGATRV